jgi:acetolactate synthase-1/2/3 large subunit
MKAQIKSDKEAYFESWANTKFNGVNPAVFINALSAEMDADDYVLTDVGNHTFLMAEHFIVKKAGHFIAPSDFNCMGYAVPAALGVKLARPASLVAAVIGDGGFLMTCMEIITATANGAGIMYCVFHDGELAQISQTQKLPYNRKTCTVLPDFSLNGIALATGAAYIEITSDEAILPSLRQARLIAAKGQPVIVDIFVDYARKTAYTKGVIQTNLARFPLNAKIRLIAKGIKRRLTHSTTHPRSEASTSSAGSLAPKASHAL